MNVKINGKIYKYNPKNCFGYSKIKCRCNALTEKICDNKNAICPFYKPKEIVSINENEIKEYREKYFTLETRNKIISTKEQLEIMLNLDSLAGYKETIENAIELINNI